MAQQRDKKSSTTVESGMLSRCRKKRSVEKFTAAVLYYMSVSCSTGTVPQIPKVNHETLMRFSLRFLDARIRFLVTWPSLEIIGMSKHFLFSLCINKLFLLRRQLCHGFTVLPLCPFPAFVMARLNLSPQRVRGTLQ